jgi:hypothetical protein
MARLGLKRAATLVMAGVTAVAAALVLWVVPAFSGGTAGQWTWVSGTIVTDDETSAAQLIAYNGSSESQEVSARAINPNGSTVASSPAGTATVQPGRTAGFTWDCSSGFGCARVYELTTPSDDVVVSLVYDEFDTTGLTYRGLVPPGGFTVFGPDQESAASTVVAVNGATAALQTKTAALQDDTAGLKNDTAELKTDIATLQTDVGGLKNDTAQLRKGNEKLKKQLKRVLKAVR